MEFDRRYGRSCSDKDLELERLKRAVSIQYFVVKNHLKKGLESNFEAIPRKTVTETKHTVSDGKQTYHKKRHCRGNSDRIKKSLPVTGKADSRYKVQEDQKNKRRQIWQARSARGRKRRGTRGQTQETGPAEATSRFNGRQWPTNCFPERPTQRRIHIIRGRSQYQPVRNRTVGQIQKNHSQNTQLCIEPTRSTESKRVPNAYGKYHAVTQSNAAIGSSVIQNRSSLGDRLACRSRFRNWNTKRPNPRLSSSKQPIDLRPTTFSKHR